MFNVGVCSNVVSVQCSLVVTCWERADLLAVVCVVFWRHETDLRPFKTVICVFVSSVFMLSRLFIAASWSPAGKWLISWRFLVMFNVFCYFTMWYPGSGVVLDCIVS